MGNQMDSIPDRLDDLSPVKRALLELREMRAKFEAIERERHTPIAIIGMGCRFPGAPDPKAFWQLLRDGGDAITEVPEDRWSIDAYYDPDPAAPGKMSTRSGGFLPQVDQFDPDFFGISRQEVPSMDPQQRLLLEVSWEALEYAGQVPSELVGIPAGVFVGMSNGDYARLLGANPKQIDPYCGVGNAFSVAAGRISYILGLQGPSLAVDTACSSSLVAVHLACQSLRAGECRLALAGGVNLMLAPEASITFSKARMMAADGRCKTFDAAADGYVRGEGCGIVVLKRLDDAQADGDRILALLRGTAVNQDGRSNGLTAPNRLAQEALLRTALTQAMVAATDVNYVEAFGTGTVLGDPIEVQALGAVLCEGRTVANRLRIGSVKTNIGHLEAAAGIAGLIKVVLALQHQAIPPHLHLHTPNPHIPWSQLPVTVATELTPWPVGEARRLAGVSAFAFSGTNAHVVVEEAPGTPHVQPEAERPLHLLTLSARSREALQELAGRYAHHLAEPASESLADVCFTTHVGRTAFVQRLAVVSGSKEEMQEQLAAWATGQAAQGVVNGSGQGASSQGIVFLFTGQGAQYAGMGRQLYETQPTFRQTLERCDAILLAHCNQSLLSILYPEPNVAPPSHETAYAEPALFALEYALATLWQSWGVEPSVVMGHGVGEYVAACIAGVFSLEDGLKLVAERARLVSTLPPDSVMEEETESRLEDFERMAQNVVFAAPRIGIISTLSGDLATDELATAVYWRRHVHEPVRFTEGMATLLLQGYGVFVEVGPQPDLLELGRQCIHGEDNNLWLPSLRPGHGNWQSMLQSLAVLYVHGVPIDWQGFDQPYSRCRVTVPTYPFQRQRYWMASAGASNAGDAGAISSLEQSLASNIHERSEMLPLPIASARSNPPTRRTFTSPQDGGSPSEEKPHDAFVPSVSAHTTESIQNTIVALVAGELCLEASEIDPRKPFVDYGLDSVITVELIQKLADWLQQSLDVTIVWSFPTIEALAQRLASDIDTAASSAEMQPTQPHLEDSTQGPTQLGILSETEIAALLRDEIATARQRKSP